MRRKEVNDKVREIRAMASVIAETNDDALINWAERDEIIEECLNVIDGLSAQLREALVSE